MDYSPAHSFSSGSLPSYRKPPVNEVVCGMRFQILEKFRIPYVGLLWDRFRKDYPIVQHAPPVASTKGEIQIDLATGLPLPRTWFISEADDQLIQFQFDRFYYNWRRRREAYPRYHHVISNFENVLDTIASFLEEYELGELKPVECELSYINHIPKGLEWNSIDDLPRIFSDFVWRIVNGRFLPSPARVSWQAEFPLPEKKGHLTVSLKQAIRIEDKVPLFVFELTSRGLGESAKKNDIREWFDVAHEWIVRGFDDLTTLEAQKIFWEREENA